MRAILATARISDGSSFSHIAKCIDISWKSADEDSLVIMDELGSGTDPAEGMGIAIAILEELKKSGALFLVTTHYPEVKEYADRYEDIVNARMEFDRESLRPMYQLKVGEAGESCALYIAKHLGFPDDMLAVAAKEAYGGKSKEVLETLNTGTALDTIRKRRTPKIERTERQKSDITTVQRFSTGDSVEVMPEKFIGIVVKPADRKGDVLVQIKKEKVMINHKRLKLKVSASELYPEDYDFSIIFDTVENRKARHQMGKHHQDGLIIQSDGENRI